MSTRTGLTPELFEKALQAIEEDPLHLPADLEELVRQSPALAELRVHWLALEDAPVPLAPAGYFQALPGRILQKLPPQVAIRARSTASLWLAAAAALMLAVGVGGFWAGRANRTPLVNAKSLDIEPMKELPVADAPFQDSDDVMTQIQNLSPEQIQALQDTVRKAQ